MITYHLVLWLDLAHELILLAVVILTFSFMSPGLGGLKFE
jgi:hypothetical protein